MLILDVPGRPQYRLNRLVLDVNGTLAEDGHLLPGVKERLSRLRRNLEVVLITADTHGRQVAIDRELDLEAVRLLPDRPEAEQKQRVVRRLGAENSVAVGNGANDALMLKEAAIGIAVLEAEGTSARALQNADLVSRSINEALDLLLNHRRLIATLRQ